MARGKKNPQEKGVSGKDKNFGKRACRVRNPASLLPLPSTNNPTSYHERITFACPSQVSRLDSLTTEIQLLQAVNHPHIIKLVDVFEDEQYLHIVTDLCTGGELFDRIMVKSNTKEVSGTANSRSCVLNAGRSSGSVRLITRFRHRKRLFHLLQQRWGWVQV